MIIFILPAIVVFLAVTRSCFYAVNQPLVRQTGKLIDGEKSKRYYDGYGFFKENIYYWSNLSLGDTPQKLENADRETFVVLSEWYAKDKNRVYYHSNPDIYVDAPTFEVEVDGDNYILRDKNHVYRLVRSNEPSEKEREFKVVPDANPATFRELGNKWSKDDKTIYYNYEKTDADLQTFMNISEYFSKDKNYLYFSYLEQVESIIKERCNTDELVYIPNSYYIYTRTNLYYGNDKVLLSLPLKDAASIEWGEIMGDGLWLKADGKVVLRGEWLNDPRVDESTFASLGGSQFFKDANNVYYWKWNTRNLILMDNADLHTFEQVGGSYAKDKNHVYYRDEIVPDANPKDFYYDEETRYGYSGKNVYFLGEKESKR
ncbi:MAG: DKNYY domain-containing protein [Tannerella sp.]|nr:DKNYY domain-containing protein [Tannerella sp.]